MCCVHLHSWHHCCPYAGKPSSKAAGSQCFSLPNFVSPWLLKGCPFFMKLLCQAMKLSCKELPKKKEKGHIYRSLIFFVKICLE